jgi:hypothetical protein
MPIAVKNRPLPSCGGKIKKLTSRHHDSGGTAMNIFGRNNIAVICYPMEMKERYPVLI